MQARMPFPLNDFFHFVVLPPPSQSRALIDQSAVDKPQASPNNKKGRGIVGIFVLRLLFYNSVVDYIDQNGCMESTPVWSQPIKINNDDDRVGAISPLRNQSWQWQTLKPFFLVLFSSWLL
jgi:hypothetical protein